MRLEKWRRILRICSFYTACAFLIITIIFVNIRLSGKYASAGAQNDQSNYSANSQASQAQSPYAASYADWAYRIAAYNGVIGVFEQGSDVPYMILNVRVSTLPAADQALLQQGIFAADKLQMLHVLEDYES